MNAPSTRAASPALVGVAYWLHDHFCTPGLPCQRRTRRARLLRCGLQEPGTVDIGELQVRNNSEKGRAFPSRSTARCLESYSVLDMSVLLQVEYLFTN
jgi:hypothetical protein